MCPVSCVDVSCFLCADCDAHRGLVDGLTTPNWRPRPPIVPSLATLLIEKIAIMLLDPQKPIQKDPWAIASTRTVGESVRLDPQKPLEI